MEKLGRTSKAALLALTLTITAFVTGIPNVNAGMEMPTYAHIAVSPNPVGVNQPVVGFRYLHQEHQARLDHVGKVIK